MFGLETNIDASDLKKALDIVIDRNPNADIEITEETLNPYSGGGSYLASYLVIMSFTDGEREALEDCGFKFRANKTGRKAYFEYVR